ncbi:O-antigen ligase family protein [uncultured Flavobacterium sp.]|uniref:O-antigen ligase family protein n=1 Tax=uncultured Flavobacterium sp. TaxID=165435 RepID=UPI0025EAB816|nr:O-antigen ligase family protein [uncultured Flavobacterium sp.]
MIVSLSWTTDVKTTLNALSREAPLLFIPIVFCFNQQLSRKVVGKILTNYSLGIILFAIILLGRAIYRYNIDGNTDVFFYHELATDAINAIYLSVLVSMALMYFVCKKQKTFGGYIMLFFLLVFLFLLSSKVIIITNVVLIAMYYIFYSGMTVKSRVVAVLLLSIMAGGLGYYGKINERIANEFTSSEKLESSGGVHYVTLKEAWSRNDFNGNDYLNGTSFRLYQVRIFKEMLEEDPILFTGYGLNASYDKIEEQGIKHNLIHGSEEGMFYNKLNFHNQYVQTFADLGILGLLLIIIMLVVNLKNGLLKKDFIHIAFAIVMISLFLTESFLWRQRGVVFFTIFYCIFNTTLLPITADTKKI